MSYSISSFVSSVYKYLSNASKLFKIKKWGSIQFLAMFIVFVLVVSILFFGTNSIKEGLLSDSNITKIKDILKKHTEDVTKICDEGIAKIQKIKFNSIEGMAVNPILGDDTYTSIAKIDKITDIKSTNKDLLQALAEINGKKYTATQILLNRLIELNVSDDSGFTGILNQHSITPVINGNETTAAVIKTYLDSITVSSGKM
jgi:hypothetical protein